MRQVVLARAGARRSATRVAILSWALACCFGRATAQCAAVSAPDNGSLVGCTDGEVLDNSESCTAQCDEGYDCDTADCEFQCAADVLTSPECTPRACDLPEKPPFSDWGTCDDLATFSAGTLEHGSHCFIECADSLIGRPREDVIPVGEEDNGPASKWVRLTCTLGDLGNSTGPGPGQIACAEPEKCTLLANQDLPANATWGTCTTVHETLGDTARELDHGESCQMGCETGFNVSTTGVDEISCDDGIVTNDMECEYVEPPEPEPEPNTWEDEGTYVIYDIEGTVVLECTSAEDEEYLYTVPATGEGCPDSDDVTNEMVDTYNELYEGDRSGDPCVWDPFYKEEYPSAAGVNLTLAWSYAEMEAEWEEREDFQADFESEMSDLLQVHVDRLKTFRTFRDDGVVITGEGTSLETRSAVYRTVVEFIIQLEEPITNTDDELDPTQAAELLIEYYYNQGQDDDHPESVLYKYSKNLRILSRIDKTAGLDVIVTCGQDPCEPTQEGMLEFLIAGLFVSSVCIVGCVVLMYGRGKLSWIVN